MQEFCKVVDDWNLVLGHRVIGGEGILNLKCIMIEGDLQCAFSMFHTIGQEKTVQGGYLLKQQCLVSPFQLERKRYPQFSGRKYAFKEEFKANHVPFRKTPDVKLVIFLQIHHR
ncbi:MAG: hypothetical protein D6732_01700, partial [Methanobacteriota archaeon]